MANCLAILLLFGSIWVIPSAQSVLNCNAIAAEDKVQCHLSNPNSTTCQAFGCCWDPSQADMKCFTKQGGQCLHYTSGICLPALNTTLPSYRNAHRFVDNKLGMVGTERFLVLVQNVIQRYAKDDLNCQRILADMLCHYTLQPCTEDGSVISFCREDCEATFKNCHSSLQQVIGAAKLIADQGHIEFVHIGFPNCSLHKYKYEYDDLKNQTCISTGFFNYTAKVKDAPTQPPPEEDKVNILAIVLPVVIILLLVIFVIVIFIMRRESKKREDALHNSSFLLNKDALTMRQKLRADSMKSIDQRLLRLYDPDKLHPYPLDRVEYVRDLGEGHFGKVFQGRANLEGKPNKIIPVAVKALKEGSSKELKDEFYQEVTLMSILDHPHIVRLLAVSNEEEPYGMIFEYMNQGDLNHFLRNAKPAERSVNKGSDDAKVFLSKEDLICIADQVASGMEYLSGLKFVHRDLAARNCLVNEDMVVKIADFGMSRDVYGSNYYKMSRETMLPIRWLAPEAFLYGKFTIMSDVYSYGVVLWETFTFGLQPYYGYTNKEVTEFIKKGIHLGKPDDCPDHIYAIMKDCWLKEPDERVDFDLIQKRLKDPYGNYDRPKPIDKPPQGKGEKKENDRPDGPPLDFGNYDVPKTGPDSSTYDIPKGDGEDEGHGTYDIPKSPEPHDNYDVPTSENDKPPNTRDSSSSVVDIPPGNSDDEGEGSSKLYAKPPMARDKDGNRVVVV